MVQIHYTPTLAILLFTTPIVIAGLHRLYSRLIPTTTKRQWAQEERMPQELRSAQLELNETALAIQHPVSLRGRVDQGFRIRNGTLVLVDTKTRKEHTIYAEDVRQLSIYGFMLRTRGEASLASYGYIRTVVPVRVNERSVQYHKVSLMDNGHVLHILTRRDRPSL